MDEADVPAELRRDHAGWSCDVALPSWPALACGRWCTTSAGACGVRPAAFPVPAVVGCGDACEVDPEGFKRGPQPRGTFLEADGVEPDPERARFYRLLYDLAS